MKTRKRGGGGGWEEQTRTHAKAHTPLLFILASTGPISPASNAQSTADMFISATRAARSAATHSDAADPLSEQKLPRRSGSSPSPVEVACRHTTSATRRCRPRVAAAGGGPYRLSRARARRASATA